MLERQVVAASIGGHRRTGGAEELHQLYALVPQLQVNHPNVRTANAVELIDHRPSSLPVAHLLEGEDAGVEGNGSVHIGDGHGHRSDLQCMSLRRPRLAGKPELECCEKQPCQTQPAECPPTKHCSPPRVAAGASHCWWPRPGD